MGPEAIGGLIGGRGRGGPACGFIAVGPERIFFSMPSKTGPFAPPDEGVGGALPWSGFRRTRCCPRSGCGTSPSSRTLAFRRFSSRSYPLPAGINSLLDGHPYPGSSTALLLIQPLCHQAQSQLLSVALPSPSRGHDFLPLPVSMTPLSSVASSVSSVVGDPLVGSQVGIAWRSALLSQRRPHRLYVIER